VQSLRNLSYRNFREIGFDRAAQFTHTSNWVARTLGRPSIEVGLLYARIRYGLDLTLVSPETAVAASHVPVLLIHGSKDVNTPRGTRSLSRRAIPMGGIAVDRAWCRAYGSLKRPSPKSFSGACLSGFNLAAKGRSAARE